VPADFHGCRKSQQPASEILTRNRSLTARIVVHCDRRIATNHRPHGGTSSTQGQTGSALGRRIGVTSTHSSLTQALSGESCRNSPHMRSHMSIARTPSGRSAQQAASRARLIASSSGAGWSRGRPRWRERPADPSPSLKFARELPGNEILLTLTTTLASPARAIPPEPGTER
jgi:hypothetical protein